jgi:hypothetical protein
MRKICWLFLISFTFTFLASITSAQAAVIPTFSILEVTEGEKVTIQTKNFPANKNFAVRMDTFGEKAENGKLVDTVESGKGGTLIFTFDIPASLSNENIIAIRLDSTTTGHYAYNYFSNQTFGSHNGGTSPDTDPGDEMIKAMAVKAGAYVTLKTFNFPEDETYVVLMQVYHTTDDPYEVGALDTEDDGSLTKTFDIPEALKTAHQLDIRVESEEGDLIASTWFTNQAGESGGAGEDSEEDIPRLIILSVVKNEAVEIETRHFPPEKTFQVLMGEMGTEGIDGIEVGTFESNDGGSIKGTFGIPDDLHDSNMIAIRLQTSDNTTYTYNWFYNATTGAAGTETGTETDNEEETEDQTIDENDESEEDTAIPNFTITQVVKAQDISISAHDFPKNRMLKVLMGTIGTKGTNGILVDTISSGATGSFTETFEIPTLLSNDYQIAIRLETNDGLYYAHNWFYNKTYP